MKFSVEVSVSVQFSIPVEAGSEQEAREIAENRAYTDYLNAQPDELNAVALVARKEG